MSTDTSVGRGPASGGNENHDGDPRKTTLGETVGQEPAAGGTVVEDASPQLPSGVPGGNAKPGVTQAAQAFPDGPNVENSPGELEAARGNLPEQQ
jgi:hypothetical protein